MSVTVLRATIGNLDQVAPLFDAYREFYGEPSDLAVARSFLKERFQQKESIVLLAIDDSGHAVGFTQLYPSFSSVRAARIYILNDLFVALEARGGGVAVLLLSEAAEVARGLGAVRLTLATAVTNHTAQRLYETQGWKRDDAFFHYDLEL